MIGVRGVPGEGVPVGGVPVGGVPVGGVPVGGVPVGGVPVRGVPDKAGIRRAVLSRRAALPPETRDRAGRAAADALAGRAWRKVAAYLAVGGEPETAALLAALGEREVLLPVLLPDRDLDWARADGGIARGPHGLLEPQGRRLGREAVADCDLVVVPALSVDGNGNRLGRGGGSYDRVLPRTRGWVVALLHDGEMIAPLPAEPHDAPVHAVVLPSRGLVRLRPHPSDGADTSTTGAGTSTTGAGTSTTGRVT
ncbi:MAG: 5-formyltetrahydrofolate cyclo-ligase [Mycobacteriales bacterium]